MDKSSINSLNSKRNLKLPPIQGALPTNVYEERSWKTNKADPISLHSHHRTRFNKDALRARNFHSINHVDLNARVDNFPRQKAIFSSPRQQLQTSTVQINLGHEFPKSYTVLPPINNNKTNSVSRTKKLTNGSTKVSLKTAQKRPVSEETNAAPKSCSSTAITLSERRRERFQEKQKASKQENLPDVAVSVPEPEDSGTKDNKEEQKEEEDGVSRKRSTTFLLHTKCKRYGRRGGVCLENEHTLTNVAEQLKEIFLRRNMEEMYLI